MDKLELYVPEPEDLWFYQKMMNDPATMSYNAGLDLSFDGYHRDTGCIDYPDDVLPDWYNRWIGKEPERFFAYIRRCEDGEWIGDVHFRYDPEKDWHDMGILIFAPYRGRGYATGALKLLLNHAFLDCGVSKIHNHFEPARKAARSIRTKAGFQELGEEKGMVHFLLTKANYFPQNL